MELAEAMNYEHNIIAVTHVYGMKVRGENSMSDEVFEKLRKKGVKLVTAAHAWSGHKGMCRNCFNGCR